jgi:hypothetical protein
MRGTGSRRSIAGVAALAAVLLSACGAPGSSLVPSGSAAPSQAPSVAPTVAATDLPSPSAAGTPTLPPVAAESPNTSEACAKAPDNRAWDVELGPRAVVRVAVAELNLRREPCVAGPVVGILEQGMLLILDDMPYGPVRGNGSRWYLAGVARNVGPAPNQLPALPGTPFPDGTDTDFGWVAVTDGAQPFVTEEDARCPTTVDLANVVAMLPSERLACFDEPIVVEGTYGCGGCGGAGGPIGEPAWLADTFEFQQIRVRWGDGFEPVGIHFPPSGPTPPADGSIIRVTVHVDDPAASACTFLWGTEEPPFITPASMATEWCRQRLVVDSYEVIGTDTNFPV